MYIRLGKDHGIWIIDYGVMDLEPFLHFRTSIQRRRSLRIGTVALYNSAFAHFSSPSSSQLALQLVPPSFYASPRSLYIPTFIHFYKRNPFSCLFFSHRLIPSYPAFAFALYTTKCTLVQAKYKRLSNTPSPPIAMPVALI